MWRCALGLHQGDYVTVYGYFGEPEPVWMCRHCGGEYPDVQPMSWRISDAFWSLRPTEAYLSWCIRRDIEREERERAERGD